MNNIVVRSRPPTAAGRLHPRYDKEAGILVVESTVSTRWTYGVDIDGTMVFDLDDQRVLANIDFHVPKERWLRDLDEKRPRVVAAPGNVEFALATVRHKSFHLPVQARTDAAGHTLQIGIGSMAPTRGVALSDRCVALLADDNLVGFLITGV